MTRAKPTPLPDRFALRDLIGHGTHGRVYRATERSSGRDVAIKFIADRPNQRAAVQAARLARLDHPNIVPILETGEHRGTEYLVMPFVEGGSLSDSFDSGEFTPRQTLDLLAGVAGAVDAAHAAGLLHRDIKPTNILVAEDPEPRGLLIDFGTVATIDADADRPFVGTRVYAAPEQLAGRVTPQSDIYALAAVLYQCLTGRYPRLSSGAFSPFEAERPAEEMTSIERALRPVLRKGLALRPHERYPRASDLIGSARTTLERELPDTLDRVPSAEARDRRPPPTTLTA